jgi:hypothetical protein
VPFREVSAKANSNVEEAFMEMAEEVITKMSPEPVPGDRTTSFKIVGTKVEGEDEIQAAAALQARKKKKCC